MARFSAIALALLLALGFLSLHDETARAAAGSKITIHLPNEPATLDWNLSNRRIDNLLIQNLQEGLVGFTESLQPVPDIAERWTVSADGRVYTFFLRPGVRWSDGAPLVAQQFVDSWQRLLSPVTGTANGYFLLDVVNAKEFVRGEIPEFSKVGIKAKSDLVLEVTLKMPRWNWLSNLALVSTYPIRQDLIERYGAKFWTAPGNLVTLGPYVLASHEYGKNFILKRNPLFGRTGNVDEVEFRIVADASEIKAFDSGSLDVICYLAARSTAGAPKGSVHWSPPLITRRLDFNFKRYPTSRRDVREAIARAIDRRALAQALGPSSSPAASAATPVLASFSKSLGIAYDPKGAKALIRGGGLENLKLDLLVPTFDEHAEEDLATAEAIRKQLVANLGADVTVTPAPTEQAYSLLRDTESYSLLLRDWSVDGPDPEQFYSFYGSATKKSSTWTDPRYDQLLALARDKKDPAQRAAAYLELDRYLVQGNVGMLPLLYISDEALVGPRVRLGAHSRSSCDLRGMTAGRN